MPSEPRPSPDTLPPLDDDAAFAVGFPQGGPSADVTTNAQWLDAPSIDDAAAPEGLANSVDGWAQGDDGAAQAILDGASDGAQEGSCTAPLSPGDLVIDELMIESVAGAGDDGEWLEVRSTLGCTANLLGLHGECPRAASVITFDVTSDLWVPAGATFIVADSMVPAINHYLPEPVVTWAGRQGDVLRNQGSTVSLLMNGVLIDSVTYPDLKLKVGRSWEFPSDCDPSLRADFGNWQQATSSWFPAFFGTPNAANDDVQCP
jgi:hypothetical protein